MDNTYIMYKYKERQREKKNAKRHHLMDLVGIKRNEDLQDGIANMWNIVG